MLKASDKIVLQSWSGGSLIDVWIPFLRVVAV